MEEHERIKIIVVDDSEFSRKAIIEILENEGFKVVGDANSAEKAIQLAQTNPCDLFIIDVVMPEAGGIDLAKYLAENFSEDFKIIMISSLRMDQLIVEAISNGACDFIQKPFEKETLINSVAKIESDLIYNR